MSRLAGVVQAIDGVAAAISIGGRTVLGLDTNQVPAAWSHVTKIDPEPGKRLPLASPRYLQHTSAVSVGGSSDVTGETTAETFDLVNAAGATAFHEPSAARHVTDRTRDQAAFLAIPEVLNGDGEALVGVLGEGIEYAKDELAPSMLAEKLPIPVGSALEGKLSTFAASWLLREAVFEAYIIMNLDSAAAREANVTEEDRLSPREATQRALAAEHHLESEVVYLEYSGTFGGDEAVSLLEAMDDALTWPRLWYGGGLARREDAERVLAAGADAVVVGNVFHEIAPEEAALYEAAREDLDADADRAAVESWLETEVEPAETSAARYLSTVTSVPDPERRAVRYLAAGVHFGLGLRAVADDLDDPDAADVRRALAGDDVPGATAFADAMDEGARELARRLGRSVLADHFDVEAAGGDEHRHLALEL
jgi:phosphoglycerol geranylgeranyltransferase